MRNAVREILHIARTVLGVEQYRTLNDAVGATGNTAYENGSKLFMADRVGFRRIG